MQRVELLRVVEPLVLCELARGGLEALDPHGVRVRRLFSVVTEAREPPVGFTGEPHHDPVAPGNQELVLRARD